MARVESPDEVLVVAAILGHLEAFEELVLRYRAAVVRVARRIVGSEDAEDVTQDALLLAFKALPSIEEPGKFAAWLFAITRHRALRYSKQERAKQAKRVMMDEMLLEKIGALARPFPDHADEEEIMRAMESVPGEYSLALKLHFLDEMPGKRIAAFLGLPLSTIKWRLHHGKKLLRAQVELFRGGKQDGKGDRKTS